MPGFSSRLDFDQLFEKKMNAGIAADNRKLDILQQNADTDLLEANNLNSFRQGTLGIEGYNAANAAGVENLPNMFGSTGRLRDLSMSRLGGPDPLAGEWSEMNYCKGGKVSLRRKANVPGMAKGGKVQMPGPIGDEAKDDGTDKVPVNVREGEYLLNPETVAHLGGGDYSQGVRNLDQLVRRATGKEPGAMPPEGEGYAADGLWVQRDLLPQELINANNPAAARMAALEARRPPVNPELRVTPPIRESYAPTGARSGAPAPEITKVGGVNTRRFPGAQSVQGDAYVAEQARRATDGFGKPTTAPEAAAPKAAAPKGPAPGSAGFRGPVKPSLFGSAGQWDDFAQSMKSPKYPNQLNWGNTGRLTSLRGANVGRVLPMVGFGAGVYNAVNPENTTGERVLGGADALASAAMFTPAAPAAALYGTGRLAQEGGKALYENVLQGTDLADAIGGTINELGLKSGLWGYDGGTPAQAEAIARQIEANPVAEAKAANGGRDPRMDQLQEVEVTAERIANNPELAGYVRPDGLRGAPQMSEGDQYALAQALQAEDWGGSANRADWQPIEGTNGRVSRAGTYGGQRVDVQTGRFGEPSFTGNQPKAQAEQVAAEKAAAAKPKGLREVALEQINSTNINNRKMGMETLRELERQDKTLAAAAAASGAKTAKDFDASLEKMFTESTYDDNGQLKGDAVNRNALKGFRQYAADYGVDLRSLDPNQLTEFASAYNQSFGINQNFNKAYKDSPYSSSYGEPVVRVPNRSLGILDAMTSEGIDLGDVWDYYGEPMYSRGVPNEEGDAQMLPQSMALGGRNGQVDLRTLNFLNDLAQSLSNR